MRHALTISAFTLFTLLLGCAASQGPVKPKTTPDFPPKVDSQTCNSNGTCKTDVFARIKDDGSCEVMPEYLTVNVTAGRTPKMRWDVKTLMPQSAYDFKFEFDASTPVYGIEIVGNDPTQDFANPGYEVIGGKPDKTKFVWDNKHRRSMSFNYKIRVLSRPRNEDAWTVCAELDPRVVNE